MNRYEVTVADATGRWMTFTYAAMSGREAAAICRARARRNGARRIRIVRVARAWKEGE